jgi:hypothetical protein
MDDSGDEHVRAFSLISVPVKQWKAGFRAIKEYRAKLRATDGIFVRKELHATKFLSGHGYFSDRNVTLDRRCEILPECLSVIAGIPEVRLFNAMGQLRNENLLFERMLNRLNRAMQEWDSYAIIVSDEGKNYTRLARQMAAFNPIPSRFGTWGNLGPVRNIVVDRLIDDLFYRKSHDSYFIQAVDFCSYALFRSEHHLPSKNKFNIHKAFDALIPICQTQCFRNDPRRLGIIRDT